MYDIEKIVEAHSVAEAIRALEADPAAVVIAGGSDVLIKIREGRLAGCSLVSIRGIRELEGVTMEADGAIVIGPCTTFSHVTKNEIIEAHVPMLGRAVDEAGGPQLRNIGTIGGNVCNGVTSADSASTLLVLEAELELTGPQGTRRVALEQFYKGPGKVDLQHSELLTAIRIPKKSYEGLFGHYIKYAQRKAMDIATLGCAAGVRLCADKTRLEELRLAYGVAAPTPIRCRATEEAAHGQALTPELLALIGRTAVTEVNPRTSWRASKEFRLQLVEELAKRAVRQAVADAGGAVNE